MGRIIRLPKADNMATAADMTGEFRFELNSVYDQWPTSMSPSAAAGRAASRRHAARRWCSSSWARAGSSTATRARRDGASCSTSCLCVLLRMPLRLRSAWNHQPTSAGRYRRHRTGASGREAVKGRGPADAPVDLRAQQGCPRVRPGAGCGEVRKLQGAGRVSSDQMDRRTSRPTTPASIRQQSLDHRRTLLGLCPTCHREVHYGALRQIGTSACRLVSVNWRAGSDLSATKRRRGAS